AVSMPTSLSTSLYLAFLSLFFFNATPPTAIYTLSLHDALPISSSRPALPPSRSPAGWCRAPLSRSSCRGSSPRRSWCPTCCSQRSEEHTSELQSPCNLVCRLLLEKKKVTLPRARASTVCCQVSG